MFRAKSLRLIFLARCTYGMAFPKSFPRIQCGASRTIAGTAAGFTRLKFCDEIVAGEVLGVFWYNNVREGGASLIFMCVSNFSNFRFSNTPRIQFVLCRP